MSNKNFLSHLAIVSGLMFTILIIVSCKDGTKEVQQFALKFAEKVSKNHVDSIRAFYPHSEKIDSFSLIYNPDSIVVKELPEEGFYKVEFGNGASIVVERKEGETTYMKVTKSYGMIALKNISRELAQKTGWIEQTMTDAEIAERTKDEYFISWLSKKAIEQMKSKVTVINSSITKGNTNYEMRTVEIIYKVVVENKNACDISGDAYVIKVVERGYECTSWWDMGERRYPYTESLKSLKGETIPKNGTATYSWTDDDIETAHSGRIRESLKCTIVFEPSKEDALAVYVPNGTEYKEYMKEKDS